MLEYLTEALSTLIAWPNPLWLVLGVIFGLIIGIIPGMAGSVAIALLIPFSFTMDPVVAVLFLMAAYSPSGFGGMTTSILVNTPGTPENAATIFDGYPMAKQGRAAAAIGAGTASSVLGGFIGVVVLLAILPLAKAAVLSFSYPEFFMMAVVGLMLIAFITERSLLKGLVAAGFGLALAFIGLNPVTGQPRFTFDMYYLWDGIDIVPVLIGLFAGAEVLKLFGSGKAVATTDIAVSGGDTSRKTRYPVLEAPVHFGEGVIAALRHFGLVVRSSLIGVLIGIVPGVGGSTASFLSYAQAKQTSKSPHEFGKGNVEGVIASEASNDAKDGGSLIPTIVFGIPGTVGMAVLLGALIMHGVPAGPGLITEHMDLVYMLVLSTVVAKIVAPVFVWIIARFSTFITALRPGIITPIVVAVAVVGTFTVNLEIVDVGVMLFFGYVGYAMDRYGFSRIALCIALVLGSLIEQSYVQTMTAFDSVGEVATRPITICLFVVLVLIIGIAVRQGVKNRRRDDLVHKTGDTESKGNDETEISGVGMIVFCLLLACFSGALLMDAMSEMEGLARRVPILVLTPLFIGCCIYLLKAVGVTISTLRAQRKMAVSPTITAHESSSGYENRSDVTDISGVEISGMDSTETQILARQGIFAVWSVSLMVAGWLVGFLVAIPLGLFVFIKFIAKESMLLSILIAAGTGGFAYLLFDLMLGVSL